MPDKNQILDHIHDPEKITMLRHILDLPEIASRNYTATDSDFLDPYECRLVASILHHYPEVEAAFLPEGEWERKVVTFTPPYIDGKDAIRAFRIDAGAELSHRAILGSLLGLGIERSKIGDIVLGTDCYVFVKREISDFILLSLKKVGRVGVSVEPVAPESVPRPEEPWKKSAAVVQSMRLDAVVRAVTHMRRDEVQALISKGLVKVNFKKIKRAHETVEPGDLLSVRGFGRIQIFEEVKPTKKGKMRFQYGTLDSK